MTVRLYLVTVSIEEVGITVRAKPEQRQVLGPAMGEENIGVIDE